MARKASIVDKETKEIRRMILETSYNAQAGHMPSAMSIVEIVYTIYKDIREEDVFILSKGHGCLALYSVFAKMGIIPKEELNTFCKYDSRLGGHPHSGKMKEIYSSSGSLGHGLPMAVGVALAKKISNCPGRVFCLIGDGESNEGTIWESFLLANNLNLDNLVCLVDDNNSQIRSLPMEAIEKKIEQFGWSVETCNGHDQEEIKLKLKKQDNPLCLVCKTTKGKGFRSMEDNMFAWHHGPPSNDQLKILLKELEDA